jgi:hypothetical protein
MIATNDQEAIMLKTGFIQSATKIKEKGFKLPLSALVRGKSILGRFFTETTVISYISHHGASFRLKTPVALGRKLNLAIDLPPKLGRKDLKLFIQGKVVFVEATSLQDSLQKVSLRFGNTYRIQAEV